MSVCYQCKKPLDFSNARVTLKFSRSKSGTKTLTVRCPHCGAVNSKEVSK